jgi:uncharacterized membrane protein YccC
MTQTNDIPSRVDRLETIVADVASSLNQLIDIVFQDRRAFNDAITRLADSQIEYMQRTEARIEQLENTHGEQMAQMRENLTSTNAAIERLDAIILRMDQRMTLLENR